MIRRIANGPTCVKRRAVLAIRTKEHDVQMTSCVLLRRCYKCKEEKPLDSFFRNSGKKLGRARECKECRRKYKKEAGPRPRKKYPLGTQPKKCCGCQEVKPAEGFSPDYRSPSGLASRCHECTRIQANDWYKRNKEALRKPRLERYRTHYIKRKYGISKDEYFKILESQGGVCAICKGNQVKHGVYLAIDHDHKTGAVRGILCNSCNSALGLFKDDETTIENALQYIRNSKKEQTE